MLPHRSFDLSDLRLTPDETGRRRPQIPRRHIHCPQWRKARPQARSLDLEHPDWRRQVAQPPWSQIDEVYSAEQARRRLGQQDLNEAVKKAVRASIKFLADKMDMDRATAMDYLSAATDFEVTQVVDRTKGIHTRIRKKDFGEAR